MIIIILMLLQSCGEAPTTNALTQNRGASGNLAVTVHYLGQAMPNVMVSLDATGDIYTKTDNTGTATFTKVKAGVHDIHVFPNEHSGTWLSLYEVSGSQVFVDITRFASSTSAVSGAISKLPNNTSNIKILFKDRANTSFVGDTVPTASTHTGTLSFENMNTGMVLTGDLFFLAEETVGNTMKLRNTQALLGKSISSSNALNQDIIFPAAQASLARVLATITNVTAPPNMTVQSLAWQYAPPIYGQTADLYRQDNLILPSPNAPLYIQTYDSPDLASSFAYIRIQDAISTPMWKLITKIAKYGSTSLSSQFSKAPNIQAGQSNKLTITPATSTATILGGYTTNTLNIRAAGNKQVLWKVLFPPQTTTIQLPTIPAPITAILKAGFSYEVEYQTEIIGTYTYQQMVTEDFSALDAKPTPWEVLKTNKVSYTR